MAINLPRILAGIILSALIGAVAYRRGSLTPSGWLGAIITGTLTFGFGGWTWGLTLIAFFLSSSALSHFRQARKQATRRREVRERWSTRSGPDPGERRGRRRVGAGLRAERRADRRCWRPSRA